MVSRVFLSLMLFACGDGLTTPPDEVPPVIVGTISGTVRAEADSLPIPGAQVVVEPGHGAAVTDTGGQFAVTFLEPGSYTLTISRTGFEPLTTIVTLPAPNPAAQLEVFLANPPNPPPPSPGDRLEVRTYIADPLPVFGGVIRFQIDLLVTDGERLSAVTIRDSLDSGFGSVITPASIDLNLEAFPEAMFEIGGDRKSLTVHLGTVAPTDGDYLRALTLSVPLPATPGVYCSTAIASSPGAPSRRESTCIAKTL